MVRVKKFHPALKHGAYSQAATADTRLTNVFESSTSASLERTDSTTRSMRRLYEVAPMDIVPIKTHRDHRRALKEIESLMAAKRNTPDGDASTC